MNILPHKIEDNGRLLVKSQGAPEYQVKVERGWSEELGKELQELRRSKLFLLTQKGFEDLFLEGFLVFLESVFPDLKREEYLVTLEPGESNKHLDRLGPVYNTLIERGADRKSLILALGGGVVGDFAGYVAASLLRGVDFVQLPTTLLAAVDASVGGKVAVNVARGKNMVGAFHQPRLVYFNIDLLQTLPEQEWNCGLAEMVKHAFLDSSGALFRFMDEHSTELRTYTSEKLREAVLDSISLKAAVVEEDEKEGGLRAVLNLGHTTAHALESLSGYGTFSHGEAVSRGLVTALIISRGKLSMPPEKETQMLELMAKLGLPLDTAGYEADALLDHMKYDKKVEGGIPLFVLMQSLGDAVFGQKVSDEQFKAAWQEQKERYG